MRAQVQVVTLDEYISFLENPTEHDITNKHINQIISMHGFKKLHRRPKKALLDALSSIELLLPFRSTLKENISSSATLTTEDVKKDLDILEWQECSLQSIENLNSTKENLLNGDEIQASYLSCVKPKVSVTVRAGRWGTKRKRNAMNAGSTPTATVTSAAGNLPFSSLLSL